VSFSSAWQSARTCTALLAGRFCHNTKGKN
jgi:hypothetical protein